MLVRILSKALNIVIILAVLCSLTIGFTGCNPKAILKQLGLNIGRWVTETNSQGVEERIGCVKGGTECFYGDTAVIRDGIPIPTWLGGIFDDEDCQNQAVQ